MIFFETLAASTFLAYIGPGMGVGLVSTILGILAAILMLIFGSIWYPLKKAFRKIFSKQPALPIETDDNAAPPS